MKHRRILLMVLLSLTIALGCQRESTAEDEMISPATPPPTTTPTDTDLALTQTTEVGEDRSPHEGGVLTDPDYSDSELSREDSRVQTEAAPPTATRPPG